MEFRSSAARSSSMERRLNSYPDSISGVDGSRSIPSCDLKRASSSLKRFVATTASARVRSFELSEKEACLTECGILESTEPPLNLVESSQRSSLSERVRPFAKTLGLFQLTGAARPLSFFMVAQGLLFLFPRERIT